MNCGLRSFLIALFAGFCGWASVFAGNLSALSYQITDLGTLTNSASVQAYSINDKGQVVGISKNSSNVNTAFVYDSSTGTVKVINTSSTNSAAYGINDAGQIVGDYSVKVKNKTTQYRFLSANGTVTNIGTGGNAYAINNNGQVVGTLNGQAYLWTATGGQVSLGSAYTSAVAISDSGIVVGKTKTGGYILNTATHQVTTINRATMTDVNDSGMAIGTITASRVTSSYVWYNGTQTLVNPLAGSSSTTAYAINDQGVVVGTSNNQAFVWDAVNGATDLNSLIGTDSGWDYLAVAKDINNLGQIVGWGVKEGQVRAFLLTRVATPEASVLLLLLCSAIFVFLRYRESSPC